jgi:molybdate transport system substrate-binding protein
MTTTTLYPRQIDEAIASFRWLSRVMLVIGLVLAGTAAAAEVKVFSTIGIRSVMQELGPRFEGATGHKLVVTFDVANALKRRIESGERFDVAILTVPVMDEMVQANKIAADTRVIIARGGMGLAVRVGVPKPDISTSEALKRALLNAKSISYPKEGLTGIHMAKVLDRLGISEAMQSKSTLTGTGSPGALVASGEVEMAAHIIPELLAVDGITLVGPLPPDQQTYIVLPCGVSADAIDPAAARQLLQFLTGPVALELIKSKGYEAGSR